MQLIPFVIKHVLTTRSKGIHSEILGVLRVIHEAILHLEKDHIVLVIDGQTLSPVLLPGDLELFLTAISSLMQRVISDWDDADGWDGDLLQRVDILSNLYWISGQFVYNEEATLAILHWLLVLLLRGYSCPLDADEERVQSLESALKVAFPLPSLKDFESGGSKNFELCIESIGKKRLLGLPQSILTFIGTGFRALLRAKGKHATVMSHLDALFRHFLDQEPHRVDPEYPTTRHDQSRTLDFFVSFSSWEARIRRDGKWKDMLSSWRDVVQHKLSGINANLGREIMSKE